MIKHTVRVTNNLLAVPNFYGGVFDHLNIIPKFIQFRITLILNNMKCVAQFGTICTILKT